MYFKVDLPKDLFPDPGEEPNKEIMNQEACNEVSSRPAFRIAHSIDVI